MSGNRAARQDSGDQTKQQTQQHNANSGEGSDSAMAAMLRKRREGENQPDEAAPRGEEAAAEE